MKTCGRYYRVRAVKSVVWEEEALSAIERQLRIVRGPVTPRARARIGPAER